MLNCKFAKNININEEIETPNSNYIWSADNNLGIIQQNGVLETKDQLGTIKISVNDISFYKNNQKDFLIYL